MADTLTSQLKASLHWLFQEPLGLSTVHDSAKLEYNETFADGVSPEQADKIWHSSRTLISAASDDLDLSALAQTIFGTTVTITLAQIRAILIINTATDDGEVLIVGAAPADTWSACFGDASHTVEVPPDSCLLLCNRISGWPVVAGVSDTLRITNAGSGNVTYRIAILGCSM
ncbi:MAG: hypothetical protein SGJ20_14070 [Planctomycetota bacterium]|nr:hypothetical protein [Planctomycetota bacterium]